MKAFWILTFFLNVLIFSSVVHAQSNSTIKTAPPKCALKCLATLIPQSSCPFTDTECICTNQQLLYSISTCVNANCTIREQLTTAKYSQETCATPALDRTKIVSIAGLTGGTLALLAFSLRILAKLRHASGEPGLDDLCLFVAVLLTVPFTAFSAVLANKGLGLDIWNVSFDNITYILYIYFWDELIYVTVLPLTKISILFFYLRVFSNKTFRTIVYVIIAFNVAFSISFIIVSVFQCKPIEGAWTRWDGTFQGHCNNINMHGWMNAAINLLLDFVTLLLPMPLLAKLGLSRRRKVHIFLMFSVGFFVTIVSILRLQTLVRFANTTNLTQDYVTLGYWSTIEVHVGIICACMPAIRQLLRNVFPSALGSTNLDSMPTTTGLSHSKRASSKANAHTPQPSEDSGKTGSYNDQSSIHALVDVENRPAYGIAM